MKAFLTVFSAMVLALSLAGVLFVYTGIYNVFADDPHWDVTARVLGALRERSIARRIEDVPVPDLDSRRLIAQGAGQYAAMCVVCHLAPGIQPTELSRGLYPAPPQLAQRRMDPRVAFTIVKHGIKMSGMPAWAGHGDEQIWSVVAFIGQLPEMNAQQYREYVNSPDAAAAMAAHSPALPAAEAASPAMKMEGAHGAPGHHEPPATR